MSNKYIYDDIPAEFRLDLQMCDRVITQHKQTIKEAEFQKSLVEQKQCDLIKSYLHSLPFYFIFDAYIEAAFYYAADPSQYNTKKDKDKKTAYEIIKGLIQDNIYVGAEIREIHSYGYDGYAYRIEFTTAESDHVFGLVVPCYSVLKPSNLDDADYGQIHLVRNDNCVLTLLASSYDTIEIEVALRTFLN